MVELLWLMNHLNFVFFSKIRVRVAYWHVVGLDVFRIVLKRNSFKSYLARDNIYDFVRFGKRAHSLSDDLRLFGVSNHFDFSETLRFNPFWLPWILDSTGGVDRLLLGSLFDPVNSQLLPQILVLGWRLELLLVELGDDGFTVVVALSHRVVVLVVANLWVVILSIESSRSLNLVVSHWVWHDSLRLRLRWLLT